MRTSKTTFKVTLHGLIVLAGLAASPLAAEITQCTSIETLPAVISNQGIYCLTHDLATTESSGNAIEIATNNVTLDCNGWKVGGLGGGPETTAVGIRADARFNITIRNCNIRGFRYGIDLPGGSGHLIEDVLLDQNYEAAIRVIASNTVIRNNRIVNTGSGLIAASYGILVGGLGHELTGNNISQVTDVDGGGTGILVGGGDAFLVNNRFYAMETGIHSFGSFVMYRNNLFLDVDAPVFCAPPTGCNNSGNNDAFNP